MNPSRLCASACRSSTLQRVAQELAGGVEVALRRSSLSRACIRSSAALAAAAGGFRDIAALLFQRRPERVIALAHLGIDFERALERGRGAGEIAA